ncbi:restriction endonuclease [Streptomyces sp. NPDC018955]|uniref:restriction endonuclease n=1 Tax=Streptomyces sp. NPDC018955 TaxID=3365055 RepID=UPI0037BC4881
MSVQGVEGSDAPQDPTNESAAFRRAAWKQGCLGIIFLALGVYAFYRGAREWATFDGEYTLWAAGPFFGLAAGSLGLTFLSDLATVSEARRHHSPAPSSSKTLPIAPLTWRDAELMAAQHMRQIGYLDAHDTGMGSDAGIDVEAAGAVAQVKMMKRPVSRPDVQRLAGAAGQGAAKALLFYSWQGYTSKALEWADSQGMLLFEFDLAGNVWPVNRAAREALRRPRT